MVKVAALLATAVTVAVIPVGAVVAFVPAELAYQATDPAVPDATLAVVAVKVADPAAPPVIVPDWVPRDTVAAVGLVFELEEEPDMGLEHPYSARQKRAKEKNSCHPLEFIDKKLRIIMPLLLCGSS
jgi:hypothetical protein